MLNVVHLSVGLSPPVPCLSVLGENARFISNLFIYNFPSAQKRAFYSVFEITAFCGNIII